VKREGNLIARIVERENLRHALGLALRGHHGRRLPYKSADEVDAWLAELGCDILAGTVAVGAYRRFVVHDPKRRVIHAPSFRERVLHHAILNIAGPRLERLSIFDSYASRLDKGVHRARARAREFCQRFGYYLKLDVRAYFDSIDHERLLESLARLFKEPALLRLLEQIIRAYQTALGKGMPIGSLVSQHSANAYLAPVDRLIKEGLKAKGYVRYMDDMVLWHDSAEVLAAWEREVADFAMNELRLLLKHPRWLGRCRDGLEFLGAVVPEHHIVHVANVALGLQAFLDQAIDRRQIRIGRVLGALEAEHAVGRIGSPALQARGSALVAALAHTRSLAWRRKKLSMRQEAR
jgi:RNA-directed DNA polymerase